MPELRDTLASIVVSSGPRILALLDKNPLSPTYGSFDRRYWQYKISDFPCGMQQELVLPLAYLWKTPFEKNRYHALPRMREFIEAAMLYHARAMHPDGSLDDYFPHERAFGATAYALSALTEAALMTGIKPPSAIESFERSGRFLAGYREAGKLSNHLAIAALALANLHALTGDAGWKEASVRLMAELALAQHPEGWFPEYQGCDLGYQSVTVEFLCRAHKRLPSDETYAMLSRAVEFIERLAHPDGSLGGEYASRNTYNFYPGGFALLSPDMPPAARMLGLFMYGLENGSGNHLEDDGVFGHMLSSYVTVLNAPEAKAEAPSGVVAASPHIDVYPGAGFFVGRTGSLSIYGSLTKGGCFKVFDKRTLIHSDTGFAGELEDSRAFCQNKPLSSTGIVEGLEVRIRGRLQRYRAKRLTRLQMAGLRLLSICFGRFRAYSNLIRSLMQRLIIYHRDELQAEYTRTIRLGKGAVDVEDSLRFEGGLKPRKLYLSTDCVNLHVVTSDSFQSANLIEWQRIEPSAAASIKRRFQEVAG